MSIETNSPANHPESKDANRAKIGPRLEDNRFSRSEPVPHSGKLPVEEGGERPQPQHEALTATKPLSQVARRLAPVNSPADLEREPVLLPEKKSKKGLFIGVGAGATALALAAAAYFAGKESGDTKAVEPRPSATPSASASVTPGPTETAPSPTTSPEATPSVDSKNLINPEMSHEEMVENLTMRVTDSTTPQEMFALYTSRLELWANAGNSIEEYDIYPGGRNREKNQDFVQGVTNRYDPAFAEALLGSPNVEANPVAENMREVHSDTAQKFTTFHIESNQGNPEFKRTIKPDPTTLEIVEDGGSIIVVRGSMLVSDNGDQNNVVANARSAQGLPMVENLTWDLTVSFEKNKDNELHVTFVEEN